MFVKRLVEKASSSINKPLEGLKSSDVQVEARVVFHYGIPSGAQLLAYEAFQHILAISTRDGRIKLFGKDNTQSLLQSPQALPTKFLQFIQRKGVLLNVTSSNHIEVWDVEKQLLSHDHVLRNDIAVFAVMLQGEYIYAGDSLGNVSVLRLDHQTLRITPMKYTIPYSASHGNISETPAATALLCILPQPTAESRRVLLVFRDGLIALWDIRDSKLVFATGGSLPHFDNNETKKVSSACWACPFGSKVAVGYSNGEIFILSIPTGPNLRPNGDPPITPACKLNLGYRSEKVPIASLKWLHGDGKASRIYVTGAPDFTSSNLLQVVLLNDQTETRMIKLGLHLPEPCIGMEIMSSSSDANRQKQDLLVVLGKSGHVYVYDDHAIEKYLLQSQSRGSPSLPKALMLKMPHADSAITVAKFFSNDASLLNLGDEDYKLLARNLPPFFPSDGKPKDGAIIPAAHFTGFRKIKNLYITGHNDGTINFWDVSCPLLIPILSLNQQNEDGSTPRGVAVTALHFDLEHRLLVSGDHGGKVHIYKFKPEPFSSETNFLSFPGGSRKGNNHCIQSVKYTKVTGSVLTLNISRSSGHLAIGSDQGFVSVVDVGGPTLLYQNHIASDVSAGIVSLQFETCSLHGFEKNVVVVATKDSSVLVLDGDTGSTLSPSAVHPKKSSRALLMQVLGRTSNVPDQKAGNPDDDAKKQSSLLMCNEKAAYIYSLSHAAQGIKKVCYKKKFQSSSCCWASTFCSGSDVGLVLVFRTGKIEIRSLPELTLIKESSIRGFTYSAPKLNSITESPISCSHEGEMIMVNGDQEVHYVSVLLKNENFRNLDAISQVYRRDLTTADDGLGHASVVQKEKKKGLFSSVIGGSKQKQAPDMPTEDARESIEELITIFATPNFQDDDGIRESSTMDDNIDDLDIDDIDLNDPGEKTKDQNPLAALSKQKLASKFQAFKGKIKQMKVKNEKNIEKEEQNEKAGTGAVDQIKKKYGFSQSNETSAAREAQTKLQENARKLQAINVKSTMMQDTAKSFSSMAKEMLRTVEKDKHNA